MEASMDLPNIPTGYTDIIKWLLLASALFTLSSSLAYGSQSWIPASDMASARGFATATLLQSGKVLVVAGQNADGTLDTSEIYDPILNSWQAGPVISGGRTGHTATLLSDGKVLLASGLTAFSPSPPTLPGLLYDPSDGNWHSTTGSMDVRTGHSATLLDNGKVLVAGGWNGWPMNSAKLFDTTNGTFSNAAPMSTPRFEHAAAKLPDGRVLIVGGSIGGSGTISTGSAELFDPDTDSWAPAPSLVFARRAPATVVLLDGKILIVGGVVGNDTVAESEIYDPESNSWAPTGALSSGRVYLTATLLPDGSVLAAGGFGPTGPSSTSEVYNPVSGQWADAGTMLEARSQHTATFLPDGHVLVLGGAASEYLRSANLYDWDTVFSACFE